MIVLRNSNKLSYQDVCHSFERINITWNGRIDYVKTRIDLEIPDSFDMAMIAIVKKGPKDYLSEQLQEREYPSDRKPLEEIVMEGQFRR